MKFQARISEIKFYTDSVFVIRFERNGFQFKAGQYLVLSVPGIQESREYSICSGINEPWLEVLVREIPDGYFSKQLKKLEPGDVIYFDGPFGFFILNNIEIKTGEYVFIATGTGISPFISFLKSYPEINYHLVHGIRSYDENYGKDYFPLLHRTICTSRDNRGNYSGRITGFLKEKKIDPSKIYYLCGNSQMISEVSDILEDSGVAVKNIRTEVFF